MLRWLSYATDLLAGLVVLCAPVIILHWVLSVAGIQQLNIVTQPLDPVLLPLRQWAEALPIPWPKTEIGKQVITVAQLGIGIGCIFVFFILSGIGTMLRNMEMAMASKGNPFLNAHQQQEDRVREQQEKIRQQAMMRSMTLLMIAYPFGKFREALKFVSHPQGSVVARQTEGCVVQFSQPEPALNAASDIMNKLTAFSKQNGSYEAPPVIKMALHATNPTEAKDAQLRCRYILQYCQPNQVLFSTQLHEVMQSQNILQNFSCYSTGVYSIPNESPQDIYQLDVKLPGQEVYF